MPAADVIVATVNKQPCAELTAAAEPAGDMEQRGELLQLVVEILLVDNAANMAAFWGHAVTQATAFHSDAVKLAAYHQINSGFHLELNLHTTPRKNHIVGISEGMVALTGNACATVAKELLIMHRRQSKDLINWRPSMSERRLYHFVLATNAELESLLGTVDGATRDKRTQSTYATGASVFLFAFCASRV